MHPSAEDKMRYFSYHQLPEHLQVISKPFSDLAYHLAEELDLEGPQFTLCLQKLIEAKDCAVRSALS
jgi:hypothetical protein